MDLEARLHGAAPSEHPEALRLWLRMLTCTQLIEKQVRSQLRERFDTTLRLMARGVETTPQDVRAPTTHRTELPWAPLRASSQTPRRRCWRMGGR